jgi:hypothetical protein
VFVIERFAAPNEPERAEGGTVLPEKFLLFFFGPSS